jgi:hypothetical protein
LPPYRDSRCHISHTIKCLYIWRLSSWSTWRSSTRVGVNPMLCSLWSYLSRACCWVLNLHLKTNTTIGSIHININYILRSTYVRSPEIIVVLNYMHVLYWASVIFLGNMKLEYLLNFNLHNICILEWVMHY